MLSRFVRSAAVRRCVRRVGAPRFSTDVPIVDGDTGRDLDEQALKDLGPRIWFKGEGDDELLHIAPDPERVLATLEQARVSAELAQPATASEDEDEESFLTAIGLGPFHRKAALIATGAITAVANEFYVLNEETYVAACLVAGFTVMYVNLREPILEAYETFQKEALTAQTEAEEKHIAACRTLINAQRGSADLVDAVKDVFAEKEQLIHLEATARSIAERNKVAKDYQTRLQGLVNRKADEENKAYKELVENVYADVLNAAQTDDKFKKAALKYALTAISTPEKAGVNPTVELYSSKLEQ